MKAYINTAEGLATTVGVAILAATTNANVLQTGGWFTSHALLVGALSAGVFAGARVVGLGAGKIGLVIIAALCAGEAYNFSATAERIVVERENGAAPLKDELSKHTMAIEKLGSVQNMHISSPRLDLAKQTKASADAAYETELRTGGRCKTICNGLKDDAAKAQAEVIAALADAEQDRRRAVDAAKAEVEANPLPASATPLADRIGIPSWALDLIMAGLLSVGANGLAGTLIAFGAHATVSEKEIVRSSATSETGTDFDPVSMFEASKLKAMVSGEFPEPTPPKPGKRKKLPQFPENVISFRQHPVVSALKSNGGSVSSNQELADLMKVSKGEASKRWQEVENQLTVTRDGKQLRIALKA